MWTSVAAEGEWIGAELPLEPGWRDRFVEVLDAPETTWFVAEADGVVTIVGFAIADEPNGIFANVAEIVVVNPVEREADFIAAQISS